MKIYCSQKINFLSIFQTSAFNNLMSIISRPEWVSEILEIVTSALENERIEVREKAAGVLSGLLHCGFMSHEKRNELLVRTQSLEMPERRIMKGMQLYLAR